MYTKILAKRAKFGSGATVWTTVLYMYINKLFKLKYLRLFICIKLICITVEENH